MLAARYRLVSLWISQVARSLADHCLRMFIVLQVSQIPTPLAGVDPGFVIRFGLEQSSAAWHQTAPLFLAPFILLAPVSGALSNSLPKRWILVGSTAFCLCMTALFGAVAGARGDLWLWCLGLGLVETGHAVYSPARYALLPAAAQDSRLPLNRVMAWIETGRAIGAVAGLLLGSSLHGVSWPEAMAALGWESTQASRMGNSQFPVGIAAALGFNLVAVLGALPVHFPSDVRRPESAAQAIAGFFRDSKVILKDGAARDSLLGLACVLGLIAAGSGSVLAGGYPSLSLESPRDAVPQALLLISVGAAVGCLLAGVQGHPRRMLGLVPPAALGLLAALVWAASGSSLAWACVLLGLMGGLVNVPLRTTYQLATPADARGNGMAVMNAANCLSKGILAVWLFTLPWLGSVPPALRLWLFAALAAAGALLACRVLLRETIELLGEIILWPMYRIRVRGPGRFQIPLRGPLLIIANHTAWFDPLWLAKVLPRRLTPMMTSRFFDLPVLHWLMRNVAGAIRVPAAPFRREAPELQEAVAVLDRGGCVLIFPEGSMKRRPEQSLRHFGQGVGRILRQRPATPVVVCWLEGGWGSFTSYRGGPPGVNKHLDCRRLIDIAIETPQVLDPALLADQHATRNYLMDTCLKARRYLGLQPLPLPQRTTEPPQNDDRYEEEERSPSEA